MNRWSRVLLMAGVGLSLLLAACEGSPPESDEVETTDETDTVEEPADDAEGEGSGDVGAVELLDRDAGDETVARMEDGEWDGVLPEVPEDDDLVIGVRFIDADGDEVDLDGGAEAVGVEPAEDASEDIVSIEVDDNEISFHGDAEGVTSVVLQWLEDDEVAYESEPIRVVVDHFAGDYVAGREVLEPEPRLLIADGDQATAAVYDLIAEEVLETFDLEEPDPVVTTSRFGGQIAALSQPGADVVQLIDAGTWGIGHGDHGHYYIDDPRVLDLLALDDPLVPMHGPDRIGFSGGGGDALLVDELATLQAGEARSDELRTEARHPGGVVPLSRGFAAAGMASDGGEEADQVALLDGDETIDTHACPGLATMTPVAAGVAVACEGEMLIGSMGDDDWSVTSVDLLDDVAGVDELTGNIHQSAAAATDGTMLVIVDTDVGDLVEASTLPSDALSRPHIDDDGTLLIVTDDGVLHQYAITSGELVASSEETVAVDPDEDGPRPHVVGGRDRAYVSSPGDGRILEFATNDDLRLAREFEVDGVPTDLAYFGAMW